MINFSPLLKVALLSIILTSPAYAYVDGGTGLLAIQGVLAALGAFAVFMKSPRQTIVRIFSRKKQGSTGKDAKDSDNA